VTTERAGAGELVEVRWHRVDDPAGLAMLAAIVCGTVSPVDAPTGHLSTPDTGRGQTATGR